jgi:hypothetical protein
MTTLRASREGGTSVFLKNEPFFGPGDVPVAVEI